MKLLRIGIFFIFCIKTINAQVAGDYIFQFLNLSTSSRQVALGGETLTLQDDINQPLWNPSVLNESLNRKLAVNYTSFLAGINLGSLSYAQKINEKLGILYGNINYLNYGSFIEADETGNETGTFNASDIALTIGYSYSIPNTSLVVGANSKLINSTISNFSSFGFAVDLGVSYYNPLENFSFALVVRNIGAQVTSFDGTKESLPLKIALGASYQLEHVPLKWHITIDNLQQWNLSVPNPSNQTIDLEGNITEENISFLQNTLRHFVIGAELFSDRAINIRAGFNFRRAAELKLQNARTFSGLSLGFGIRMNRIKFNYAFSKYHSASNASTFSLLFDLNKK